MSRQTPELIQVALVEDHAEIREGLKYIINQAGGFSCTTFATAEEALSAVNPAQSDVVLMDINLPGMSGIECTRLLHERYPALPIMMCTAYEDDESIFHALSNGAKGYILKRAAGEILIEAIRDLFHGGSPMSSTIARKVVDSFQRRKNDAPSDLTERELEILDLLAQGYRNKQIAEKLFLSPHTIRTHIYNIYEKLQVNNRVEAVNKLSRDHQR